MLENHENVLSADAYFLVAGDTFERRILESHLKKAGINPVTFEYQPKDATYIGAHALALSPFLDPKRSLNLNMEIENNDFYFRQLTIKSLLFGGILIIFTTLFLFLLKNGLDWQYHNTEMAYQEILPSVQTRDSLKIFHDQALRSYENYHFLSQKKTRKAMELHTVSTALPESAWLTHFSTIEESGKVPMIRLEGLAIDEKAVSMYLGKLETMFFSDQVILREIVTRNKKIIKRKWGLHYPQLIVFRIDVNVKY